MLRQAQDLPVVLQAIVALDAWNELAVLQHAPWLGRLLAASILRQTGLTTAAHLAAFNFGLKSIPVDRRRHRDLENRLLAIAHGFAAAAEIGLKEHDRLALARTMMERKLDGRRTSSKLPELIELVMARPLVHAGAVSKVLGVTPQAARRIVGELGLREMTGGGGFGRGVFYEGHRRPPRRMGRAGTGRTVTGESHWREKFGRVSIITRKVLPNVVLSQSTKSRGGPISSSNLGLLAIACADAASFF